MNKLVSAAGLAALVAALPAAASAQEGERTAAQDVPAGSGNKVEARYEALPWVERAHLEGGSGITLETTCEGNGTREVELLPIFVILFWEFGDCVCHESEKLARKATMEELEAIAENPNYALSPFKTQISWTFTGGTLAEGQTREDTVYCYDVEALAQEYGLR